MKQVSKGRRANRRVLGLAGNGVEEPGTERRLRGLPRGVAAEGVPLARGRVVVGQGPVVSARERARRKRKPGGPLDE